MTLTPGTRIGPYQIIRLLGAGGMGNVFLAEDETLGRKAVLKALPPAFVADDDRRRRFEREARAVAALNHPNIVTIYGVEHAGDALLLAMEFVEGQPLSRAMPPDGLPVAQLLRIALQLADAVGGAHRHGIVHRDLKPDNVMVTNDGRVKVLDFGLAKLVDRLPGPLTGETPGDSEGSPTRTVTATEMGVIVGTPHYMSPEQAQGLRIDHRTDIFSLGVVLYEMATGGRPFEGDTSIAVLSSILKDDPRPLDERRPGMPGALARLVGRCLEKDPDLRYQDACDLRQDLEDLAAALPAPPHSRAREATGTATASDTGSAVAPGTGAEAVRGTPSTLPAPSVSTPAAATHVARPRTRIAAILAGIALALAVGAGGWWWLGRSRASEVPIDPTRVAVAPIVNRTGDASIDGLGPMVTASIARMLAGEGIAIADLDRGGGGSRSGGGPAAERERARRAGAGLAVSGELLFVGNDLVFQGRLTDVAANRDVQTFGGIAVPRATPNGITPLIEQRVAGATLFVLRGAGGVTGFSRERISMLEAPTYDAYREFQAGLENFGTNMREAKRHFEKALDLDPRIWWCLGWLVPTYEALGEFDKAERMLQQVRPTVPPAGKATIDYFEARLGGRLVEAYTAARAMFASRPTHLPTATLAAWAARDIGRPQEALDALLPITPDPGVNASAWRGWVETVSQAYHMMGRYEEERAVGERAVSTVPGASLGLLIQARALAAQGRAEELDKVLEACLTVPPSARPRPGLVIVTAASELRAHGYREASLEVAAQALRWLDGLDATLAGSAPMQLLRGSAVTGLERWKDASAHYVELSATLPESTEVRSEIGVTGAKRGDAAAARKASDLLAQMNRPFIRGAHTLGRARIAAALGERERAMDLLREAFAEGQALAWTVHDDYAFETMRGYAPFDQLVATPK